MNNDLPANWQVYKIQEVAKIYLGLTHTPIYTSDGIPFLSVKNISSGTIDFTNTKFISQKEFASFPEGAKPTKGDVLFARVGTIGLPSIVQTEQPFGTFVSLGFFRVNNEKILNTYIRYWMMSPFFEIQVALNVQGSTRKNLNTGWLKNFKINVPPLPEQKRIVEKLDKIFAAIDKAKSQTEKNLQNVREIFETTLRSCFAQGRHLWPQKRLVEVCTDFGRGKSKHRPRNDVSLYGGKYPFIQTGDIRSASHKITSYHQTYNEKGLQQSKLWPKGTLCITIAANIAETAILDFDACFPDSVIGCIFNPNLADVSYAEYLLHAFRAILQKESKGSAQANINLGTFERQTFPFPLISEQKQIVEKLDILQSKTKELEKIYTQKLADLEELKQAVLQQAFSGKL